MEAFHLADVSIPLWDDWPLQGGSKKSRRFCSGLFQSHSGTIGHFKCGGMGMTKKVRVLFQSHSGTIGHFKRLTMLYNRRRASVSIPLWDDWPLQEWTMISRGMPHERFNPTLGRLATSSGLDWLPITPFALVSIPLWDDWPLQVYVYETEPGLWERFNPTLGRLATSSPQGAAAPGRTEGFNPTLGRLATSRIVP